MQSGFKGPYQLPRILFPGERRFAESLMN